MRMPKDVQRIIRLNSDIKEKLLSCLPTPAIRPTAIEGFHLVRREDAEEPERCFGKPLIGLVIQGTKQSLIGGKDYVYTENQSIVAGVDMPIASSVINAS